MSGKGERRETEGQDVTRRNATGRRLNPFEEQRGRVSENRSRSVAVAVVVVVAEVVVVVVR